MLKVGQIGLRMGVQPLSFSANEQLDTAINVFALAERVRGQPTEIATHGGVAVVGSEIAGRWQFVVSPGVSGTTDEPPQERKQVSAVPWAAT